MVVIIRFFVPALIFFLFFHIPRLHAFSLGAIEVKSSFGDRFNAEIPINLEDTSKVEVRVGNMEDYGKLGLERPKIVEELEIKPLLAGQGNNKVINIVSNRPLFYPSFNLVIRAEKQEGTILENFLVAVDFQQNVSLSLKGKKEEVSVNPKVDETVQEAKKIPDVLSLPSAPENIGTTLAPVPPVSPTPASKPEKGQQAKPDPVTTTEKAKAETKPILPPVVSPTGMEWGKIYGPIQPGESLWRISEKISPASTSAARMTVALWMANKDKFLGGNMHGIKIGETLNLENLDNHLEGLSQSIAVEIVQSQLKEWKAMPSAQQMTAQKNVASSDIAPDPAEIIAFLEEWRKSWSEADLNRHLALFSKEKSGRTSPYEIWKGIKKRMFERHKNVEITLGQPSIALKRSRVHVGFDQHFRSTRMETFGQKTLELVRAGAEWKIVDERFVFAKKVKQGQEAPTPSPLKADAATVNPQAEIMQVLEEWRKSWEEGNLDRHMTYFSNQPTLYNNRNKTVPSKLWRKIKQPMFDRYKNVEIRLESIVVNQRGDRWIVSCDQTFRSDPLKSFGKKYFELVREGSGWKIVKEKFTKVG